MRARAVTLAAASRSRRVVDPYAYAEGQCSRTMELDAVMVRVRKRRHAERYAIDEARRRRMMQDWQASQLSSAAPPQSAADPEATSSAAGGAGGGLESNRQGRLEMRQVQRSLAPLMMGQSDSALAINALATRAKKLRFDRSPIHDWVGELAPPCAACAMRHTLAHMLHRACA